MFVADLQILIMSGMILHEEILIYASLLSQAHWSGFAVDVSCIPLQVIKMQ